MAGVAIRVRGLTKAFAGHPVLNGVDLDVRDGETLVILGGSGSGKSTLLRCLVGLERPDAGDVSVQGVDLFDGNAKEVERLRRRIGMAFQDGALFGSMTIAENVELPLREFTDLPPETRRIVARIKLGMVGLEDAMDRLPSQLSGGMIKRAALARALAMDPDIVFFDEPSAGLDPITSAEIDRLLQRLKKTFEVTLVVVTHELESAFAIADRIALLEQGSVLITGDPDELRASPDSRVQDFLNRRPRERQDGGEKFRRFIDDLKL